MQGRTFIGRPESVEAEEGEDLLDVICMQFPPSVLARRHLS